MKEYTIIKKPANLDWDTVPALDIDSLHWSPPVDITAQARICYDENALYVCLRAQEEHIRAEHTDVLGMPCEDSCLEFFFCPMPGDYRYFNIEFNPNGCMYLGFASGIHDLVRLVPDAPVIVPAVRRFDGGWEISYSVPFSFVRRFFPDFQPTSGDAIRANCFKCGDLTVQPHFLTWNPATAETPAFHRPQDFGLMHFA